MSDAPIVPQAPIAPEHSSQESAPEQSSTSKEMAEAVKRYKLKVDGEEIEVDESELQRGYQRARSANKRFEEAAKIKDQASKFLEGLQSDPFALLSHPSLGLNPRELAEKYLLQQLESEMTSPEEKQRNSEQEELRQYREQQKQAKEAQERQQIEQLKAQHAESYTKQFTQALEQVQLPKTDYTIKRMAMYTQEAVKRGYDVDMIDVAQLVKDDFVSEQRSLFAGLEGDQLVSLLGPELADKVRKHTLSKVQPQQTPFSAVKAPSQASPVQKKSKENLTDWRNNLLKNLKD